MKTLYFTIRHRVERKIRGMEMDLNFFLATTEKVQEVTRFAEDIKYMPYTSVIEKLAIHSVERNSFLNIDPQYLKENIENTDNNVIILYTQSQKDGGKKFVRIECIMTYREIRVRVGTKYKNAIYLTSIVVSRLTKDQLSLSGGDIMNWFYTKMKEAGGHAIKISAIDTAIPFWETKGKFIFDKPAKNAERKSAKNKIKAMRINATINSKKTKKLVKKLTEYVENHAEQKMHRVRSDATNLATPVTAEDSFSKIDEIV